MRSWLLLLGGLIVWTIHFFALYAVASIFLTTPLARTLTVVITLLCLAANAGIISIALRPDGQERWIRTVSFWGAALGGVAVLWQGMVAILI